MNLQFTEAPDSEISLPKSAEERSQIEEIKKVSELTQICKYHAASHWSEKDRLIGWKNNQSESLLYFNPNRFPTIRCEHESPNYPPRQKLTAKCTFYQWLSRKIRSETCIQIREKNFKQNGARNTPSLGRKPTGKHTGRRNCQAFCPVRF